MNKQKVSNTIKSTKSSTTKTNNKLTQYATKNELLKKELKNIK